MKVIILAGGLPSTIADYNEEMPKPMLEIGERPLLWHIMKYYSYFGFKDFIICAGYKSDIIKRYFADYYIYQSDITIDLETNQVIVHKKKTEDWKVTVLDTGFTSSIVERIQKTEGFISEEEFFVTYGDCVSNINIEAMLKQHQSGHKSATIGIARPTGRNKILQLGEKGDFLTAYEKNKNGQDAWTSACSMVFSKKIFRYLNSCFGDLNEDLFTYLAEIREVDTYKHEGFWMPIETKRDKVKMEELWNAGKPPWKIWKE